jgi:hypothetical protein
MYRGVEGKAERTADQLKPSPEKVETKAALDPATRCCAGRPMRGFMMLITAAVSEVENQLNCHKNHSDIISVLDPHPTAKFRFPLPDLHQN